MADGSIRDRIAMLSRGELVGLAMLLVVTLGGAALWYARSLPKPVEVRGISGSAMAAPTSASPSPEAPPLIVDVAGAVRRPGVYEFGEGDRVIDAIRAAGGATPKASLDALNLAAPLADGVQILVPVVAPAAAPPPGSGAVAGATPAALVNVNTASATDLETLPGIGEVIAQRIVDYRTQNGPFAAVDDLLAVSGIGDAILGDIRDLVTV
jgi:competence protein ComEA